MNMKEQKTDTNKASQAVVEANVKASQAVVEAGKPVWKVKNVKRNGEVVQVVFLNGKPLMPADDLG